MAVTINGTTGIVGPDGSAGTPSLQGSDANTGVFFPTADTVAISTGGSERLRVDSTGDVGVGTTPSAWASSTGNISVDVGTYASFHQDGPTGGAGVASNAYYDGTNWVYKNTNAASRYLGNPGIHQWFTAPSGTGGTTATFTERLRIDTSGAIGIGGANYGIQGDVLSSGGTSAAPSWGGAEYTQALNAARALTNTTASQAVFPAATDALTLPVGTYEYECVLHLNAMSTTSGNLSFNILGAGTATISSALSQAVGFDGNIATAGAAGYSGWTGTTSPASIVTAGTGSVLTVFINGLFRVSVAGTIIPSIALVTASAANMQTNTHMHARRISSSDTYTSFGPWA